MDEKAAACITEATQKYSAGNFSEAFDYFILAFLFNPALEEKYEADFRAALSKLNEILAVNGHIQHILHNFNRAVKIFPDNMYITNDLGKYLYRFGFYSEAWCQFQKALTMDLGFVDPEKNINSIKNLLVERWHYRMLNDNIRNEAYHAAIKETLTLLKDTVFDLGCGTGLLTLYAMEGQPAAAIACERNEQMVNITEGILKDNNINEVLVVNKLSTDLNYEDVGGKSSLLVTELFDAGLFGEFILTTLSHAHENLLFPDSRIIPNKAEFFIIGAKCDQLHKKNQLDTSIKPILKLPSSTHVITSENYDCDDVNMYKDIKYMTKSESLLKINFNDYNDIQDKLKTHEPYNVLLKVVEDGEINVLLGWFNLYLTDNITITTNPQSSKRANAWQNVVFNNFIPQTHMADTTVDFQFMLQKEHLKFSSTCHNDIVFASTDIIKFLNDCEYVSAITRSSEIATDYLAQIAKITDVTVLDLSPFPLFGLLMMNRGAKSLICYAKDERDETFTRRILSANNINDKKVSIVIRDSLLGDTFANKKFHTIFGHYIDMSGDVDLRMYQMCQGLKQSHLLPGGLFLPTSVTLMGQIIQSPWLDLNNRVYDENVSDYQIGQYINKYQVSQNFDVDLSRLEYIAITEPVYLGTFGTMESGVENLTVVKGGDANAVLCWYVVEMIDAVSVSTKRSDCFASGTTFLANPPVRMNRGDVGNVLRCVDADGAFKLMIDVDSP